MLKLGKVSLDGTHLKANASTDQNVRCQRAVEICAGAAGQPAVLPRPS